MFEWGGNNLLSHHFKNFHSYFLLIFILFHRIHILHYSTLFHLIFSSTGKTPKLRFSEELMTNLSSVFIQLLTIWFLLPIRFFQRVASMPTPAAESEKLIWTVIDIERPEIRFYQKNVSLLICMLYSNNCHIFLFAVLYTKNRCWRQMNFFCITMKVIILRIRLLHKFTSRGCRIEVLTLIVSCRFLDA